MESKAKKEKKGKGQFIVRKAKEGENEPGRRENR